MKITKQYIENIFESTIKDYSNKVKKIDNVAIKYIDKESYLEDAKNSHINKMLIERGVFKDFDNEYPSFLVVYLRDKNPLNLLFGDGKYKITICYEIAKEKLSDFKSNQVEEFLRHAFAHEITHIFHNELIKKYKDLWQQALQKNKGSEPLANETFAELMADKITSSKSYQLVETKLWQEVYVKMNNIK